MAIPQRLPLAPKVIASLVVTMVVPVYSWHYGMVNFLWGSDIALFLALVALWWERRVFASIAAVGVLLPEALWNIDFFSHLLAGRDVLGLDATGYMFDTARPLYLRALSVFHVFLPWLLLWLLYRLGYDRRALWLQTVLAWVVLPVSYLFTDPARNINWVFGFGVEPQTWMPGPVYLLLLMAAFPILVYLPTHCLLARFFPARNGNGA
jgi:hypothetical protein